jgi:DNA-directed RNA polymerase alpha subunit
VCPICEKNKKPTSGFLSKLGAPARRALEREGLDTLIKLSEISEKDLLQLHGVGPSTLPKLRESLKEKGLSFKKN